MPGRLGGNLRSGHRAEGIGIELLRGVGAVAEVRQSEDIGWDGVVTLLRTAGALLYAEGSFFVQVKATSERTIRYVDEQYEWARNLELPLFLASVDAPKGAVTLYAATQALCRTDATCYRGVELHLDPVVGTNGDILTTWLGPPVLSWTLADTYDPVFKERAYGVLRAWLHLSSRNARLRDINWMTVVRWTDGEIPTTGGQMGQSHPSELKRDMEAALPYLLKLATHRFAAKDLIDADLGMALLFEWLEQNGLGEWAQASRALIEHKRQGSQPV